VGGAVDDADGCAAVARSVDVHFVGDTVRCDDVDVTAAIRSAEVTSAVSTVSAHRGVREVLVALQRHLAGDATWVVEGRDIGTVVFPDAVCKIYLTASPRERARRRLGDDVSAGAAASGDVPSELATVEADIVRRDALDSGREHSPLRPADDAVEVDTTDLDFDEVVATLAAIWHERTAGGNCAPAR
jgi:cytidylate kinase